MTKPFGRPLPGWQAPPAPAPMVLTGTWAQLEPLIAEDHAADLFAAYAEDDQIWDYLPYGPFHSAATYHRWMRETESSSDPLFFAIRDLESGQLGGVASFLRITPAVGTIEVGHIALAPALQQSRAASEAMVLMMRWAFEAGYRRYEWKCDALNLPSRRAAQRLGFSFEGVFRQASIVKGRNRDTAWFSVIDSEWPALAEAYRLWLSPGNFSADGQQIERLSELTALVRAASDPALNG